MQEACSFLSRNCREQGKRGKDAMLKKKGKQKKKKKKGKEEK